MYCKKRGIRLSGPPLGRRKAGDTEVKMKRQMYKDSCERNAIEGRIGTGKRRFGLDLIMSKLDETAKTEAVMDILAMTGTAIYVMELKIDGSVDEALRQIDDKGYAIPYEADGRKVVKVGLNFSTDERTIKEWKVETQKN